MAAKRVDEHSDFDEALSAGLGVSSRPLYRTLAGNMRTRLAAGERVAVVAPASDYQSLSDAVSSTDRPATSTATWVAYAVGGFVLAVVFDVTWPVLIAIAIAVMVLEAVWRSRRRSDREQRRSLRSLVMVTDRRLIAGVHPNEFRELRLEQVRDVQVHSGNRGVATVRVSADPGDKDIHVATEWPKRRALAAAEAIAEAVRRGARLGAMPDGN